MDPSGDVGVDPSGDVGVAPSPSGGPGERIVNGFGSGVSSDPRRSPSARFSGFSPSRLIGALLVRSLLSSPPHPSIDARSLPAFPTPEQTPAAQPTSNEPSEMATFELYDTVASTLGICRDQVPAALRNATPSDQAELPSGARGTLRLPAVCCRPRLPSGASRAAHSVQAGRCLQSLPRLRAPRAAPKSENTALAS